MKRFLLFFLLFSATDFAQSENPLAEYLSPKSITQIEALLTGPFNGKNLEELEEKYQELVQRQTFPDLMQIYEPENAGLLEITFPSFTAEDSPPAKDRGYGLHVVKRLTLPLSEGETKVIEVNEQWPENRRNGGLFFPDEIRIKTRIFEGERYVPGSERLYLFDSIRLAWGRTREVRPYRRTRYVDSGSSRGTRLKQMRVPVSAPISCIGCHKAGNVFAQDFLGPGETVNHEAIVQNSYFRRSIEETRGYRDYVSHLEGEGRSSDFIARVKRALSNPKRSLQLPALLESLRKNLATFSWLGEDEELFQFGDHQGVYEREGHLYLDATERVPESQGKYLVWQPLTAIP